MAEKIDLMDTRILNLLQQDASLGIKEIAAQIGLSPSPTHERIKRLKREGIIEKYVALVNREKTGKQLLVLCTVTLKQQSVETLQQFEEAIIRFKEVLEVMCIAGSHDYLLKVVVNDVNDYHTFVMTHLSSIPNISNLSSNFVLKEIKRETALEL
ncbi:Lrp/AsnC family transcriptional regulator [Chitinophaga nivalis]|uniref:Lrp/AsnC family transcriptional regulator n=1 Tax=Chitinophaga nivalis TaxID=2991709 RepID=A0ABT3IGN1_9BACT|nr:Lrp/AsnC family transcriptional regulator [Chitinophaga nivalis]MCW3467183.1 Lrp/AsnC family transcriptional regulator [Chitinophaga nivalis]MCW3483125.1 Lrp/AsnC family transcriptional regulator [Chitinophaga nivalis]